MFQDKKLHKNCYLCVSGPVLQTNYYLYISGPRTSYFDTYCAKFVIYLEREYNIDNALPKMSSKA